MWTSTAAVIDIDFSNTMSHTAETMHMCVGDNIKDILRLSPG